MVEAALWLTGIGIAAILLLIPVSIRVMKNALGGHETSDPHDVSTDRESTGQSRRQSGA